MTSEKVILRIWRTGDSSSWHIWVPLEEAQAALEEIRDSKFKESDNFLEIEGGVMFEEATTLSPYVLIVKFDAIEAASIMRAEAKR